MIFLTSCGSAPPVIRNNSNFGSEPVNGTYYANYDYTWQVAQQEMQRFNLKLVNKDSGTIITDSIIGYSGGAIRSQYRYYFDVSIKAMAPEGTTPVTKVSVTKFIFKNEGLMPERQVKSNFIEEKVILYRIKKLLEIERKKIERAGNQSTAVH